MKVSFNPFYNGKLRLKVQLWENDPAKKFNELDPPLRSELYNADQMEQRGRSLASFHKINSDVFSGSQLLKRLDENEMILLEVQDLVSQALKAKRQITPAGEWLLDNFYLIEEQIRTGKRHLPKGYIKELPLLDNGPYAGFPRVYDIALEIISHGDGRVDQENLSRFVTAYQSISPLKLGELWAIPIMLRLALIENLRRVACKVAMGRIDRNLADAWADQLTETAESDPRNLILVMADMARSNPPLSTAFVAEIVRRLQGQSPALAFPLTWIEQRLAETNQTFVQVIQTVNQQQAADQVSVSNSIGSLRFLGALDWHKFVESISVVEKILRDDPANAYTRMDFATRDMYRHTIEKLSRKCNLTELQTAQKALHLAQKSAELNGKDDRTTHIGYYLFSKGLHSLKKELNLSLSIEELFERIYCKFPSLIYIGGILAITAVLTFVFYNHVLKAEVGLSHGMLLFIVLLLLISTSHLAVALINWAATILIPPQPLPRMDFSEGITEGFDTLVVVPTMINSNANIDNLTENLEVRFLANQDKRLRFGLLTDFHDAALETMPEDENLMTYAKGKIEALNRKYVQNGGDIFFLFHRKRLWNPTEVKWMGYERKRGKLGDLNALIRGETPSGFSLICGNVAVLQQTKYVITLDTDTQLPRDAARIFAAVMAHPLNRPLFDPRKKIITLGYAILQPRVAVSLPGTNRSYYARMFGSEPGIDPYTRAVSDVYQDMFGEGSFIGKGIYDVDAFEKVLSGRFRENRILSHDLLEGCHARSGLISDVLLFEDYPSGYLADVSRRHRWMRGDWQLLQWIFPIIVGGNGKLQINSLSFLSRWKIFDNLRRSLVPVALTLLLITAWCFLHPLYWTMVVILLITIPSVIITFFDFIEKPEEVPLNQHLPAASLSAKRQIEQAAFYITTLPFEAYYSLDAIIRTLWRLMITHHHLLEWNPSHVADYHSNKSLPGTYMKMWIAPFLGLLVFGIFITRNEVALFLVWPILLLWILSPAIAWRISVPISPRVAMLSISQRNFLGEIARKTWAFFEVFVNKDENWLPPDNFQEDPLGVIAHRTSPTNMGLSLLANLTAYDFGYITLLNFLQRTGNSFEVMSKLDRFQGHFYNWYDTQHLKPLRPFYISSVDSGNLAGHLLTLRSGLLSIADQPVISPGTFHGLGDTMRIIELEARGAIRTQLVPFRKTLSQASINHEQTLTKVYKNIKGLLDIATALEQGTRDADPQIVFWIRSLVHQCKEIHESITYLTPWVTLPEKQNLPDYFPGMDNIPTLRELAGRKIESPLTTTGELEVISMDVTNKEYHFNVIQMINISVQHATEQLQVKDKLINQAEAFSIMDYDFIYDEERHMQSIGYNVDEHRRDDSNYDLLASEARLSTFVGIAQGRLPQKSWFALGRLLTTTGGEPILLSWSGSMFEYLMPLLVMPTYENTILDQTYKAAVRIQIDYGKKRGIPWGISESGYNTVDVQRNYQYKAFGVPGSGLKRGLSEDTVIAPYATVMALMVMPEEACANLQRLTSDGFEGKYGYYEAVDFTPSRVPRGQRNAIIKSYMAHHQGMSLLSLSYLLLDQPMQKRFEADPQFQATLLLLQERIPRATSFYSHTIGLTDIQPDTGGVSESFIRVMKTPHTPAPEVHLLSNGNYHVMITNAGGGYSRWRNFAVTRWHEDSTADNWGSFCYIRDRKSGQYWSTAYQPTLEPAEKYEAIFSKGKAEFRLSNNDIDTHTEISVSPEDDIELRRVRITNRSRIRRQIDITTYAEVVITHPAADAMHPAFSNLFVQTEILPEKQAILCTRRPRSETEQTSFMFHMMTMHSQTSAEIYYETDRMKFIGRGNTVANPASLGKDATLSNSQGSVLDPIVSIQYPLTLSPEESITIDIVTGMADTRDIALLLINKYHDRLLANRVFELAWTHSQVVLRQINASEVEAQLYARLASSVIYANASLRADASLLIRNRKGQSGLWGYTISGDLPIVLLQIEDAAHINLVRQLVQTHAYWRLKGLAVDLIIWNEDHAGYRQLLQDQILGMITSSIEANNIDRQGGIFVRAADQISNEDRILIQTVARVIIVDTKGDLATQINRRGFGESIIPRIKISKPYRNEISPEPFSIREGLVFHNGFGGFTPDGKEYVITTNTENTTPAPWVNILANAGFGTVVSESGSAYTWNANAHEFRLTPWSNDPVSDGSGEVIYLRDEENGHFWSPTPIPSRGVNPYVTRHGLGYSVFEHMEDGIFSELWIFVALDAPIKFSMLKIRNHSGRKRKLSVTGYVDWVMGDLKAKSAMHITTESDPQTRTIFAKNPYNSEFNNYVAFFTTDEPNQTFTCDRTEFLGRNGNLRKPAAMFRAYLSGKKGAGMDPCASIQTTFEISDQEEKEVIFKLGAGKDANEASTVARRFRGTAQAHVALDAIWNYWNRTINALQIITPDASLNILANSWLIYQTLVCRVWARSGFYQSGGAFGFRDQLQDSMALIHAEPKLMRENLLLYASRQFVEGDVQHWWHPPTGRGVRTHCSDDYLWLPLAVIRYVQITGDTGVLSEQISFLTDRPVNAEDDSYYDLPNRSDETATLYEHCVRSIKKGLKMGSHGLPLIGTCDWNDGMNLVGNHGKGESVWLAFFLYDILLQFSKIAIIYHDDFFEERCLQEAARLRENIEKNGWDGEWYRRAYFDDGTPLGSSQNEECRVDSISQSWSVLSGAGNPARTQKALNAIDKYLVKREHSLIQLLDPPFDKSSLNPGYIKGYVPGVRENGGQYTHAAIWAAMAFAKKGDRKRSSEMLSMINPIHHGDTREKIDLYKVEPYIMAADVYAVPPHTGRGGWTWYTGSAGWMYRLITESILGFRREIDKLYIEPCIPEDWNEYSIRYRYRETYFHIKVMLDANQPFSIIMDGITQNERFITLIDDRIDHHVDIIFPPDLAKVPMYTDVL